MTDFDTRLTALDRALNGYAGELDHDEILTAARAFEAYLVGESEEAAPAPEPSAAEPRPLQPGDRVTIAHGAEWTTSAGPRPLWPEYFGRVGVFDRRMADGDVRVAFNDGTGIWVALGSLTLTPEPRPFKVGDTVLVAEGASFNCAGGMTRSNIAAPCEAVVCDIPDHDGDLPIEHAVTGRRHLVHPSYLTLKEGPQ